MKRYLSLLLLVLTSLLLVSCTNNGANGHGIVDCAYIYVDGITYRHSVGEKVVYKFVSNNNDFIYADFYELLNNTPKYEIVTKKDRNDANTVEYICDSFVGFITVEYNYYLNLDKNIIDVEIKYKKCTLTKEQGSKNANNNLAYKALSKTFIHTDSYALISGNGYIFYLNELENPKETHSYIKLGNNTKIEYKAKWYK